MQPFESSGIWFLPDKPDDQVAGTLTHTPSDGLRLSLTGSLSAPHGVAAHETYAVIHGVVGDSPFGRMFTLVDCFRKKLQIRMPGINEEVIYANRAFAGSDFLPHADMRFDGLQLQLNHLPSWVGISGIQTEFVKDAGKVVGVDIRYCSQDPIRATVSGKPLSITFAWSSHEKRVREAGLRQKTYLSISDLQGLTDEEIVTQYVRPLQDFFSFACDANNRIVDISLSSASDEKKKASSSFHLLFRPQYAGGETEEALSPAEMLFTFQDITDRFDGVIERWMALANERELFRNIYFGEQYRPSPYIDSRFLIVTQALLLYLSGEPEIVSNSSEMEEELYSAIGKLGAKFVKKSEWVPFVLPNRAALGFPYTLHRALEANWDILHPVFSDTAMSFVNDIVRTRAYFQYRDPELQSHALSDQQLFWAIRKLKLLLQVLLLRNLGFDSATIAKIVRRNRWYSYLSAESQ